MNSETRVEEILDSVDNHSSEESINQALLAISGAVDSVRRDAQRRTTSALVQAAAVFRASLDEFKAALSALSAVEATLKALPAAGAITFLVACLYMLAAFAAFRVEEILTGALAYLLNLKANDPRALWMGVAFASSLLLFEFLIVRLRLLDDPWPLFRAATPEGAARRGRWASVLAGVMIIAGLLGAGAVQMESIVKMAPTREQAMTLKKNAENPDAPPIPISEKVVGDAVLWFSICVLISGGYLAAAGVRELKHCTGAFYLRFHSLRECGKRLEAVRKNLDEVTAPALAGELAAGGLPYGWLMKGDLAMMSLEGLAEGVTSASGILDAAEKESQVYEAQQRHKLEDARARQRAPRPALEQVDVALGIQGL